MSILVLRTIVVFGCILFWAQAANAITVSGTVRFWDKRLDRSDATGSKLPNLGSNKNQPAPKQVLYLWDRNGGCIDVEDTCAETDDDYISSAVTSSTGTYSIAGVASGLQLYLHTFYYTTGPLQNDQENELNAVSKPIVTSGTSNLTINFNVTCWDNALNSTQGLCDNDSEVSGNFLVNEPFSNMAASMGTVALLADVFPLWGYFPDKPDGACSQTGIAGAYADGELCVDNPLRTHTLAHEMGHAYQDLELLDGGSGSSGCTGGAQWAELEVEKCVTSEGFADFVAAAVWWAPSSPDPDFNGFKLEGDTNSGNSSSVLQCVSNNDQPHRRRGNVSRFFWDLYDSTTTGDDGADTVIWTFNKTAGIWTFFPAGTADRRAQESGSNGRNVEDYIFYHVGLISERNQNCLGSQVD